MQPLSTTTFIIRRLVDDWKLLLSAFFGIIIAATLVAGAPVYTKALERQGINTAVDRSQSSFLNIFAFGPHVPLEKRGLDKSDQALDDAVQQHISDIYRGSRRYLKGPNYILRLPIRPLTNAARQMVSRGYFQYLEDLEHHVRFIEGRMATDAITSGPRGPLVEAVIGAPAVEVFRLKVGDVVTLTPSLGNSARVSATIVGVVEPIEPKGEYWQFSASTFIDPPPLEDTPDIGIEVNPLEPPLPLFVTRHAIAEGVGKAYPGTLVNSTWYIFVDKGPLKRWSISESRSRIDAFQSDLSAAMPGATVLTGIQRLMDDFEQRNFFSRVPLLVLLAVMVITLLYYLSMMVSYLVQSREGDVALLRSRGVSTLQLLQLYALEGLALTVVAVVLAPFLAMGAVALAGKLPYFHEITDGRTLPVELHWMPSLFAAGTGVLSLAIFVIPAVVGARTGLVIHKLRSSRPPSVPFFHRYYLDIGLLVLGGLVFWELESRGEIVSGGLFKDVEVNEALLLAPVLFLTVVALLFLRFFPLFVRFISGESPALLHLIMAAAVITLGPIIAVREIRDDEGLAWLGSLVVLAAVAGAYWATYRAHSQWSRLGWMVLQAGLIAMFVTLEPPAATGETSFVPTISLIVIVPAQLLFLLFAASARIIPVWALMGLWHMARNPLQYSWLVLLLLMVTGLGILATTVGKTLDRSHEERILYDVASDIRVSGIPRLYVRGHQAIKEAYLTIPGVTSVSLALRGTAVVGANAVGNQYEVLALESQDFPYISWYRDDFSSRPLSGVMRALQSQGRSEPIAIPEGATSIGLWVKPEEIYQKLALWMVLEDSRGVISTVPLGAPGPPEWHLMRAEIPSSLLPPLQLVSIQIFEQAFGPAGTPGTIFLDDIHATIGSNGEEHILDDFEGQANWTALATSMISTDIITATREEAHQGDRAGLFSFGKDTDRGIRGFYKSTGGGPVPIVVSTSFLRNTGANLGDDLIMAVEGRLVPVVIRDAVEYFPSMNTRHIGFVLADLSSMMRHINILSPLHQAAPNEIFISEAPGAGEAVREVVITLAALSHGQVHDKQSQLEEVRLDPLVTAGWRAMSILSIGIILFTAGLGYVTYLLAFADRSRAEMGFLRSLGMSRRQLSGLLALEHIIIIVIGLGLGSWAGIEMSKRMVSSVALTERGDPVVPPFILMTNWLQMGLIYAALAAIFLIALYRLNRSMTNQDLHTMARVEE